ncbi:signal transduction histidine kinase [Aliiruegeria haliotis]|uniref:histidine kinase n=1 Tax=Aliiruegeria haliotis TaxID=1280846 RepID=A0A2T0RJ77_9RHOB|nr:response regulator [Aliiruegeria haliotis]PRY21229.1 signal transduction histidine kinase [Aliiruegeria haliotis]
MNLTDKLAAERRARLAAERLLELKSRELFEANRKLSQHALKLTDQIVEQREEVRVVRHEAETLKTTNARTRQELAAAERQVEIVERRLWDSVETITDGFAVFDRQEKLIAANTAWLSLFDYSDLIQPGTGYLDVLRLAAEEGIFDLGNAAPSAWIASMLDRWDQEPIPDMTVQLWNGQYYRFHDRRSRDGDMVCLAVDISDMMAREEELRQASYRAEAANRAKSAFLANMSHEVRTPMNGVVAMTDLLLEGTQEPEQRLYLKTIRSSGEALLAIINDVLDFSRLEAEQMALRPEPFDLELMLHEVLTLVAPMVRDKGLELHVDYDLFLPTKLVGDPGRLRQVLTNLIGNAVKFTFDGYVLIRITGLELEDSDWKVHVNVEDTGIGIANDVQEHIFDKFAQVEQGKNRSFEGSGLGLAISREIVELMGGEIWVESEMGRGACFGFSVTLPCAENERPSLRELVPKQVRAMMVGGGDLDKDILSKQLRQLGLDVRCVLNGHDALREIAADPSPQILLIDESLPDITGTELANDLRSQGLVSATVLLCADARQAAATDARTFVDATLARPILRSDLLRTLADLAREHPAAAVAGMRQRTSLPDAGPDLSPENARSRPVATNTSPDQAIPGLSGACPQSTIHPEPAVIPHTPESAPAAKVGDRSGEQNAPQVQAPGGILSFASRRAHPVPLLASGPDDAAPSVRASGALPVPRQMRVLAAEDNRTNQFVFGKIVKALDIELLFVSNGREAVETYRSFQPDLIFMDISMPEMDGKQATAAIRAQNVRGGRVPIVAMTAHAMSGDKEEILAAGLDLYLSKPLRKEDILDMILTHCPRDCRPPVIGIASAVE